MARLWRAAAPTARCGSGTRPRASPSARPCRTTCRCSGSRFTRDSQTLIVVMTDGRPVSWPVPDPISTDDPRLIRRLARDNRGASGSARGASSSIRSAAAAWLEDRDQLRAGWPSAPKPAGPADDARAVARAPGRAMPSAAATATPRAGTSTISPRLGSDDWLLHARRARTFSAAGRFREADAEYARAARLAQPDDLTAWYWRRAFDAMNQDQDQTALWYLDRVAVARPDDWRVFARRADVEERLGQGGRGRRGSAASPGSASRIGLLSTIWPMIGPSSATGRAALELYEVAAAQPSRASGCMGLTNRRPSRIMPLACLRNGDRERYHRLCERLVAIRPQPCRGRSCGRPTRWPGTCALAPAALDSPTGLFTWRSARLEGVPLGSAEGHGAEYPRCGPLSRRAVFARRSRV